MKITKKGVFLTVFILLLGGFLILAPSYTFVAVKNMMTAHENREEALKEANVLSGGENGVGFDRNLCYNKCADKKYCFKKCYAAPGNQIGA